MDKFDSKNLFSTGIDMIRDEIQNCMVYVLGVALIVFLGFALPIVGKYLANERIKAERVETAGSDPVKLS